MGRAITVALPDRLHIVVPDAPQGISAAAGACPSTFQGLAPPMWCVMPADQAVPPAPHLLLNALQPCLITPHPLADCASPRPCGRSSTSVRLGAALPRQHDWLIRQPPRREACGSPSAVAPEAHHAEPPQRGRQRVRSSPPSITLAGSGPVDASPRPRAARPAQDRRTTQSLSFAPQALERRQAERAAESVPLAQRSPRSPCYLAEGVRLSMRRDACIIASACLHPACSLTRLRAVTARCHRRTGGGCGA